MILPGSLFLWLLQCTLLLLGNADNTHPIRGVPGKDYPNFETIPQTSFRCSEQLYIPGLYADPETGCQMYHHCYDHRHESFLCPPGTIFNQAILVCDYWYSAECSEATLHYGDNSPHKVSFNHETEFVPKKNPSINIFDKMASLYEIKEHAPSNSKKYRSNDYTLEESNHFSDGHILGTHTNMIENQKYPNSYLEGANLHDRREGVLAESPDEYSYSQDENDSFTDFESSGEYEDIDEHVFTDDDLLLLNETEEQVDFEKQYFAYNRSKPSENDTKHGIPVNKNEELLIDTYTDFAGEQVSSSKEDLKSIDKFVRRQSENIENRNVRRKNKRRKPIFAIKSEAEMEHFTTTENPKEETEVISKDIVDYPTSTDLKDSVNGFKSLSTPAPSRSKRRKPIFIDLEELPQYNVDNGQNVPGGTKTSSINYGVNHQPNIPNFSIAAEEISVKLFPSKVELKPINGYLLEPTEKYNDGDRNIEFRSLNERELSGLASNNYDASTFSTLEDSERFEDVSINLGQVYPKRKKKIIHIIDSEDDHNVYDENKEPVDAAIYTTEFEDKITTQSLNENFEVFDKFSKLNVIYHDEENLHDIESDSEEVSTEQYEDSYTFTSPYTHIEVSDASDGTYFTEINPEVKFSTKKYYGESVHEDNTNFVNPKTLQDFEVNKHEEMHDSPYVTTEFSFSEMSTHMPPEFKYTEDTTQIYFIPNTAQSTFDNQVATESIRNLFPEAVHNSHDVKESLANNFESNPFYQTSVESFSYKPLDNSKIKDPVTEYSHSENDDLQNLIHQLPYETNKERDPSENSGYKESNLNYEGKISNENISHAESEISRKEVEFDTFLDTELQEYLSNENSNIENNFNFNVAEDIFTEPTILEDSSKYSLESQFDVDALEAHDAMQNEEGFIYHTVPPKLESDHNIHLPGDPIEMDTFENIKQESVKSNGGDFETSYFEASSIVFDGSRTENLDVLDSENTIAPDFELFESQNIPSHLLESSFDPKPNFNRKNTAKDATKIENDKFVSFSETNILNKGISNLEQNIPGNIKRDPKDEPVRRPREFISPYQTGFDLETFDSQNFASLPYAMLKLKQNSMNKVLPGYIHRLRSESMAYSTRTGNLLESPKISKLISIGKNLLRSKKAKLRMLSKYVNYF